MLGYNNYNVAIENFRRQNSKFFKSVISPTAARKRWNTELKKITQESGIWLPLYSLITQNPCSRSNLIATGACTSTCLCIWTH